MADPRLPKGLIALVSWLLISEGSILAEGTSCPPGYMENSEACTCHGSYKRCWDEQGFKTSGPGLQPVIVELHPWRSSGLGFKGEYTDLHSRALADGAALVWPSGAKGTAVGNAGDDDIVYSWNAGPACCKPACDDQEDDVGFLRKLVQNVKSRHSFVDPNRVYFSGFSNGCALSQRMALEASDITAAVACTGLMVLVNKAASFLPTPVMVLMGQNDHLRNANAYTHLSTGGLVAPNADLMAAHAKWKEWNKCSGVDATYQVRGSTKYIGSNCAADVMLLDISGGEHNPNTLGFNGQTSGELMWSFLKQHSWTKAAVMTANATTSTKRITASLTTTVKSNAAATSTTASATTSTNMITPSLTTTVKSHAAATSSTANASSTSASTQWSLPSSGSDVATAAGAIKASTSVAPSAVAFLFAFASLTIE